MSSDVRAIVIFPYSGFIGNEKRKSLLERLIKVAATRTDKPVVLVINHDTLQEGWREEELNAWITQDLGDVGADRIEKTIAWSVDTCQMWLHGWGYVFDKYPDTNRIVQLPGDLSRLSKEEEFFDEQLPNFISRSDPQLIVGDFNTGQAHSAKDLIDQYGTIPLVANWFPDACRAILSKPLLHPRSEFLNISGELLKWLLQYRKFAYEQTLNSLIVVWEERDLVFWERNVAIHRLGVIGDDEGFRKFRDCLDQIERMERMLKMVWRELRWKQDAVPLQEVQLYEALDKRSTSIREAGRITLSQMLGIGIPDGSGRAPRP